ncbi:MAG: D-glycerate dehydrogenase, partial [Pseudomonadota bacterium]
MPGARPKVVVTRRLPEPVETRMRELFDVTLNEADAPMDPETLGQAMQTADVLVPTLTDKIDQKLLAHAGLNLRLIANYGAGVDHIDVGTARSRGILVSNTPDVLSEDTADMTMALILAVPRRLTEGLAVMQSGDWDGWRPTGITGYRLGGKRLGIVGMGRIGQAVARRARAFGMQVHYHNRRRLHEDIEREVDATYWESLDQMLARVDIVSVNCPHTPATFHLLSARRLKLLKPTAYVVNTARGEIIDENALIRMLEAGELSGAGLDVFEHQPGINPRLLRQPNVVVLPHMASATEEGRIEMWSYVSEELPSV